MSTLNYWAAAVVATTAAACMPAHANETAQAKERAGHSEAAPQAQMRVYRDPQTGRLVERPVTAKQKLDAARAVQAAGDARVLRIDHPGGMRQYQLNGAGDEALIATRRADGALEYRCAEHGVVDGQDHPAEGRTRDDR